MPESPTSEGDRTDVQLPETAESDAVASTEAYETEDGVVFYDAENPMAWLQAVAALDLEKMV